MSGFEIVGLVVTLGEIATLGVKTATKLHELHENVTKSLQDAKRLRLQVDAIVRLLNQVKEQLDRSAAVASKQQLLRDVSVPAQSCEAVLREILHSASIALSDSLRDTIWRRTKYAVFTLPQVQDYCNELSHCSVTFLGFLCLLGQSVAQGKSSADR